MNFYTLYRIAQPSLHRSTARCSSASTRRRIEAAQELIDTTPEALLRIPSPPMADFIEALSSR